ncbi:Glycosyltransferase involved in cell wall bisynthesis [Rhizobiales bacterium GAS191]|nr:Glycosyltransferase involved in cell wall bisynthesis [Rhizobiales bacterium GAS113]SEE53418.1 Glycosyltransferase involved in cell wall bisynthesis [Rhizobiales bacterium GAS191]
MNSLAPTRVELSVVIPVFNEAENLGPLVARLSPVLEKETPDWEILFVDDGSRDASMEAIRRLNAGERRVRALSFSRNFGKEVAIAAGLDAAQGNAVIIMDADLQHPPEIISEFVKRWREGYAVVYAQRQGRAYEGPLKRGFTRLFYQIFARLGETQLFEEAGDFQLFDRQAVDALRLLGERARFSKGLYSWIGFKSIGVPFEVGERLHGQSRYNYRKLLHFAWDGIASFTTVPLRIWTYLGFLISLGAIITAIYFTLEALFVGVKTPGFPTLIIAVTLLAGVQLMSLGMIGEYVGRIFAEVKRRPLYIVAERVGLASAPRRAGVPGDSDADS